MARTRTQTRPKARVLEVKPDPAYAQIQPGADFIDAYQTHVAHNGLEAAQAARLMFQNQPQWIEGLMRLRNALVKPLGLKTGSDHPKGLSTIGIFPILSVAPNRVILGFDDHHLDFRVVVEATWLASGSQVTLATLVKRNNRLGRVYLALIMPFHKLIVRNTLKRLALAAA
jgi:hypothetical protein